MISAMTGRTILHVDLDAFFAAVEQRDHPELRGKPVAVGGGGAYLRGVVAAASYEARVFGVRSAMPSRTAAALCPDLIFVPVDGAKYAAVSKEIMAILRRYTDALEPISIDEAFLDVTGSIALFGPGEQIARSIKGAIRSEVNLTASVGVAATKLVAKVGSDLRKPDGLVVVPPGHEPAFLAPLPISRLWGVGPSTATVLREYGVATIGDLAALPIDVLVRRFGKHGASLHDRALGVDPDPVSGRDPAKSVGHEHTFDVDTSDQEFIERTLLAMAEGVSGRLRTAGLRAGTVAVKIRDTTFRTITRQGPLSPPTDMTEPIWRGALELARPELRGMKVRLVGVTCSNFEGNDQLGLFEEAPPDRVRKRRAIEAADTIRKRYGDRAVTRARLVGSHLPSPFERDPRTALEHRVGAMEPGDSDSKKRAAATAPPGANGDTDTWPPSDAES
jgi:DNA polymerase-4